MFAFTNQYLFLIHVITKHFSSYTTTFSRYTTDEGSCITTKTFGYYKKQLLIGESKRRTVNITLLNHSR